MPPVSRDVEEKTGIHFDENAAIAAPRIATAGGSLGSLPRTARNCCADQLEDGLIICATVGHEAGRHPVWPLTPGCGLPERSARRESGGRATDGDDSHAPPR